MEAAGDKAIKQSKSAGNFKNLRERVIKKELKPEKSVFSELFHKEKDKKEKDKEKAIKDFIASAGMKLEEEEEEDKKDGNEKK